MIPGNENRTPGTPTPKERMLRAYRGEFSDRYPVAPEFWYYYPAKTLGVSMIEEAKKPEGGAWT